LYVLLVFKTIGATTVKLYIVTNKVKFFMSCQCLFQTLCCTTGIFSSIAELCT